MVTFDSQFSHLIKVHIWFTIFTFDKGYQNLWSRFSNTVICVFLVVKMFSCVEKHTETNYTKYITIQCTHIYIPILIHATCKKFLSIWSARKLFYTNIFVQKFTGQKNWITVELAKGCSLLPFCSCLLCLSWSCSYHIHVCGTLYAAWFSFDAA